MAMADMAEGQPPGGLRRVRMAGRDLPTSLNQQFQVFRGGAAASANDTDDGSSRRTQPAPCEWLRLQRIDRLAVDVERQPGVGHARDRQRPIALPGYAWVRAYAPARWSSSDPITSIGKPSRIVSAAAMSVPSSIRPVVSKVTCACTGILHAGLVEGVVNAGIAALTSRISWEVSISSRSTPPWINADRLFAENIHQFVEGDVGELRVIGERAACRSGRWTRPQSRCYRLPRRMSSASLSRQLARPARLISSTRPASPYSAMVMRLARKVLVSITSTPTSRNERWISSTASGYADDQVIVAADVPLAAKSLGGQVDALHAGAHGAVEDEHLFAERREAAVGVIYNSVFPGR